MIEVYLPDVIHPPFLRELPDGDMALVIPGLPKWDDTCVMNDGRLASVQVGFRDDVCITFHDGERVLLSRGEALDAISGRIDRRLRVRQGRWAS